MSREVQMLREELEKQAPGEYRVWTHPGTWQPVCVAQVGRVPVRAIAKSALPRDSAYYLAQDIMAWFHRPCDDYPFGK